MILSKREQKVYDIVKNNPMIESWQLVTLARVTNPGGVTSDINKKIAPDHIKCVKVYTKDDKKHFYKLEENILRRA